MEKIHKRFLDKAVKIRKDYKKTLEKLYSKENLMLSYKETIVSIGEDMKSFIRENGDIVDENATNILNGKLLEIEKNIIKVQDEIRPINEKIEKLKKESTSLYTNIVDYYPGILETDVQSQIIKRLENEKLL